MVAAVWLGVFFGVMLFGWGCLPQTIGDRRGKVKAPPTDEADPKKGGD